MILEEGVKLFNATSLNSNEIVFISDGTSLVNKDDYHPNSYLPSQFRTLTEEEEVLLICNYENCPDNINECVALFKSPETLVDSISNSKICSFENTRSYYSYLSENKNLLNDIDIELQKFIGPLQRDDYKKFLGFSIAKPVLSTGRDIKTDKYFGLHIDTSGQPFGEFNRPNRILINCGNSVRHFYFINLNVENLIPKVGLEVKSGMELCASFLEKFPDYPVISLKLLPGYGYIAPTDNIIHDGSTIDVEGNDYVVSLLGNFNPRKL